MKNSFFIFLVFFSVFSTTAQWTASKKMAPVKAKDTVKTEVVEVITKYNPEIADASKIRKNPVIKLLERSKKKQLTYNIFSAPVASTFKPKSGVVKGINVGVKERIYDNYIAAGFGNYTSPYLEAYLHRNTRFESEFGLSAKYAASFDNVENTVLNSNFSNLTANLFYKQEQRYFDWKVNLETARNEYNWYGLQTNTFTPNIVDGISENQTYNYFKVAGEVDFLDAYLDETSIAVAYFTDAFKSNELLINLDATLDLPIDFLSSNLNNLTINTGFEFLNGKFEDDYVSENELSYSIFTANLNPEYKTELGSFSLKLGTKIFASFDVENSVNHFLVYPDIKIEKAIIKKYLNVYAGVFGDLHTNTYKSYSDENPFVSPTLFITQTSEKYNVFIGFNGTINNDLSFNISGRIKEEQDKPLFIKNNSKSNGVSSSSNGIAFKGYEYGNSLTVIYDDIKTFSVLAETEYDLTKKITLGLNLQLDNYTTTLQDEAWNLPTLQTSFFGKYKSNKWYATTNVFYVGERKDVLYNAAFPAGPSSVQNLDAFVDVNLNGGFHFNDKFSAFVRMNNILNTSYERFADFNVQGFQILGGLTYKFDY
jgi:hypothetical protein